MMFRRRFRVTVSVWAMDSMSMAVSDRPFSTCMVSGRMSVAEDKESFGPILVDAYRSTLTVMAGHYRMTRQS